MSFAIVEKKNNLAVHFLFTRLVDAEHHLTKVIPIYVNKCLFKNVLLTANDFEIINDLKEHATYLEGIAL